MINSKTTFHDSTAPAHLPPKVVVVILNWNGYTDTIQCVRSLEQCLGPPPHLIVVDNASTDGSEKRIREACPSVEVIQAGANLGFAGGNNLGIRRALELGADYVWVLNNDTVVHERALECLLDRVNEDPSIAICGSTLVDFHGGACVQAFAGATYHPWTGISRDIGRHSELRAAPPPRELERHLDYVIGASMFVSRTFLEHAGLIDERYFLFFEELDWAARVPQGMRLGWAPGSLVYHKEGASIGKNRKQETASTAKRFRYEFFLIRSRIIFTRRFFPWCLPTVVARILATVLIRLLRGDFVRAALLGRAFLAVTSRWPVERVLTWNASVPGTSEPDVKAPEEADRGTGSD